MTTAQSETGRPPGSTKSHAWTARSSLLLALLITLSSLYGLLAAHPYRDLPEATLIAARAQDVCSIVVAVLLVALARRTSARSHVIRLGLLAYVAYSYAIYLIGLAPDENAFVRRSVWDD